MKLLLSLEAEYPSQAKRLQESVTAPQESIDPLYIPSLDHEYSQPGTSIMTAPAAPYKS